MSFIEIAFQAEICRHEIDDPEYEEYARRNCNETRETRAKGIEELRRMIYERGECHSRRMDDAYLLRFLRCRRFIPALAHKLASAINSSPLTNGVQADRTVLALLLPDVQT
ncbi:unnamed protein product [Plutella xylostella]|uniref:(diamondback moth) hypothetical protein n=1 Tax=Plutella xylostella TaxID=51655 RepID=A0A8S4FN91_PLUXY|nr:unnamed protein product [Plutella xylostella]